MNSSSNNLRREFSTQRLVLRPMAEADAALFCDLYTDADTMRFIGPPLSPERAARGFCRILRLMRQPSADQVFFTLSERSSGDAIGIGSIQHLDIPGRRAEAGMIIGTQHRDRGWAREGLSGLIRFAFEQLPLDEVWVQIHADHTVVEKLVVSVGLSRGSMGAAYDSDPVMRIWSARRDSWPESSLRSSGSQARVEFIGDDYSSGECNVRRDRVLGTAGPGRTSASRIGSGDRAGTVPCADRSQAAGGHPE